MKRPQSAGIYVAVFGGIAVALAAVQGRIDAGDRPEVGKPAPPLEVQRLDGRRWRLADQRGKVVLIDFWARWCKPCVRQMPGLERLHRKMAATGLRLLSVNIEGASVEAVGAWVRRRRLSFPVATDSSGDAAARFRVSRIPLLVLIGREGKVRKIYDATATERDIEIDVRALLSG